MNCKLTNTDLTTHGGMLWGEGVTHEAAGDSGQGLCSDGWIHYYEDPLLASFMRTEYGYDGDVFAWECIPEGEVKRDGQLKSGCRRLTTIRKIPLPVITTEQRVEIAIRCALVVYHEPSFIRWAENWISGADRSEKSAEEWAAARAAEWAARAKWAELDLLSIIREVVK